MTKKGKGKKLTLKMLLARFSKKQRAQSMFGRSRSRFGRSRRSRFGSSTTTDPMATLAPAPVEYGPGYASNTQSYPNVFAPFFGQRVPFENPSEWYYPNSNGEIQYPHMLIN